MGSKSFKDKSSFLYAIITEIVIAVIAMVFLKKYIALVIIALIIAILLLKENFWSIIATLLTGLGFDMYYSGETENLIILIFVLFIGTFLEIGFNYARKAGIEVRESDPTFWNKVLFASLCMPISAGFIFLRVSFSEINHPETQRLIGDLIAVPMPDATKRMMDFGFNVFFGYLDDFFMILNADSFFSGINQLIILILWLVVIMPWFWSGILTGIQRSNFNFGKGNKIVFRTFLAYIGQLIILPLTLIVAITIPQFFVVFNIESVLPILYFPDFALVGSTVFMYLTYSFITSIGATWGASWSKT